jgi:hypothetical protein
MIMRRAGATIPRRHYTFKGSGLELSTQTAALPTSGWYSLIKGHDQMAKRRVYSHCTASELYDEMKLFFFNAEIAFQFQSQLAVNCQIQLV